MARLSRPGGLSAAGKKELWERWRAGKSISDIARALQKAPGSIHGMIEATGGFSPPPLDPEIYELAQILAGLPQMI